MIQRQSYPISNLVLTNELLIVYIHRFWSDIFSKMKNSNHLMLMCKVQYMDSDLGYRSLGDLRKVNFEDRDLFLAYLVQRLGLLTEEYATYPVTKITFTYFVKSGVLTGTKASDNRRLLANPEIKSSTVHNFNNLALPITMLPSEYGDVISQSVHIVNNNKIERFIVINADRTYQIDTSIDKLINTVKLLGGFDLTWIDTCISEDVIKREIGKSILFFMAGVKILRKKALTGKAFTKLTPDTDLNSKFVTMDIETVKVSNIITPYLISAYNGIDYISSYANLNLDQKVLFDSFINQLLTFFPKKHKH